MMYLLIEPVWNRNLFKPFVPNTTLELLIEPVWNRNESHVCALAEGFFHVF